MNSKMIGKLASTIMLTVLLMGVATVAGAAVVYSENFESGYAAGALTGQNGWNNDLTGQGSPGNNMVIDLTAGNPGVGVVHTGGASGILRGNSTPHGVPIISGDKYVLSGDIYMQPGTYASIGLRGAGGKYFIMEAQNNTPGNGFFFEATGLPLAGNHPGIVTEQWYHLNLDWMAGANATWTVFDASNAQVFSDTFNTSGFVGPGGLTVIEIFSSSIAGGGNAAYDNLSFITTSIPEPSSMALIGFGVWVLGMRRKRTTFGF